LGLGVASVGIDFWDFAEEMVRQGYDRFIVDLTDCRSMDSTFMGVLVGIAESPEVAKDAGVVVVNPSEHHMKLMEGLGLSKIITIRESPTELPDVEMRRLASFPRSSRERVLRIREVHEKLVALDGCNEPKFRMFLKLLNREITQS